VLTPHVVFAVHDSGMGLSPEQQAHLFEPFNRLGAERTPVEGTGIGLVIVKRLVELMQGRIEVSSQPDAGTRFRVWLPRAERAAEPQDSDFGQRVRTNFGSLDTGSGVDATLTLLYAEDNAINVELLRQVMRMRPQWHLEIARDGHAAIAMARAEPPDLLLLDMHLGDMSGLDVSDALLMDAHTALIPRVALSADVMPDQIAEARQRGFIEYLTKPLDVSRLLHLLDCCARGEVP
jgi:CheY-like chemotaxis protein